MDRTFRRNVILVGMAHVAAIAAIYFWQRWNPQSLKEEITWLDGEAAPESGGQKTPEEPTDEVTPTPMPTPEAGARDSPAPSEIVLPGARMSPTETPAPSPTPTATPRQTPTPKPKPSPKPTPKATPKPKPKATPKPHASPKPKKVTPKASPRPSAASSDDEDGGDSESASTPSKTTGKKVKGANGAGTGSAKTPGGHAGGGKSNSEYGWYYAMIHDRFYSRWEQPTSIVTSNQNFVSLVRIRIEKDGRISNVALAKSSGNVVMDESVMAAAKQVTQIDPLPEGLGEGSYEININFELNQSQ